MMNHLPADVGRVSMRPKNPNKYPTLLKTIYYHAHLLEVIYRYACLIEPS